MKQESMTPAQYRALLKSKAEEEDKQVRSKYGSQYVEVDGFLFQSGKEAKYYGQCKIRVLAKELVRFEMQVGYDISINGVHVTKYRADFVLYYPDGRWEVVDVKSSATAAIPLYKLKKKLMLAVLGITIIEK